jgi:DNA repair exonuclease SbcCD nuclease subunit
MDFCFVHAADLHLDSPFTGIRTVSPKLAGQLQDASLEAFDRLIDLAVQHGAAFLLLAGDIYDQSERGVRAQLRFLRGMQRLQSNNISVYCAFGNHDHVEGDWPAVREWPGNVRFFPAEEVGVFEARTSGQLLATIYGCSYGRRAMRENMALHYHASAAERLHIGVLHCSLGARGEAGAYSDCTEEELARAGMDYWRSGTSISMTSCARAILGSSIRAACRGGALDHPSKAPRARSLSGCGVKRSRKSTSTPWTAFASFR